MILLHIYVMILEVEISVFWFYTSNVTSMNIKNLLDYNFSGKNLAQVLISNPSFK